MQIYAIGIFEPVSARGRTAEELSGPSLLTEIAEQTGGRHFPVENLNELPDVAAKIGIELRNQYVLGYTPTNQERDGKYRRVQVKLVQPRGLPPLRAFCAHWILCTCQIGSRPPCWSRPPSFGPAAGSRAGGHGRSSAPTRGWWCCTPRWSTRTAIW